MSKYFMSWVRVNHGVSDYDYGVIFIAFVQKIILCPIIYTTEHFFLQMCHIKPQNIFHGNFQPFAFDLKKIEFVPAAVPCLVPVKSNHVVEHAAHTCWLQVSCSITTYLHNNKIFCCHYKTKAYNKRRFYLMLILLWDYIWLYYSI